MKKKYKAMFYMFGKLWGCMASLAIIAGCAANSSSHMSSSISISVELDVEHREILVSHFPTYNHVMVIKTLIGTEHCIPNQISFSTGIPCVPLDKSEGLIPSVAYEGTFVTYAKNGRDLLLAYYTRNGHNLNKVTFDEQGDIDSLTVYGEKGRNAPVVYKFDWKSLVTTVELLQHDTQGEPTIETKQEPMDRYHRLVLIKERDNLKCYAQISHDIVEQVNQYGWKAPFSFTISAPFISRSQPININVVAAPAPHDKAEIHSGDNGPPT